MLYLASLMYFSVVFGLDPISWKLPDRIWEMRQNPKCMQIHWRWIMLRNSAICHPYSTSLCICMEYHEIESYQNAKSSCAQMGGNLALVESREKLDWLAIWLYETMSNLHQSPAVNKTQEIIDVIVVEEKHQLNLNLFQDRHISHIKDIKSAVGYEAYVGLEWLQSKWSWARGSTVTEAAHLYWHPFKMAHSYHKYGTIFITRVNTCSAIPPVFCNGNEFGEQDEVQLGHSTQNDGAGAYICEIETKQEQMIEIVPGTPCNIIEEMWLRQFKNNIAGADFIIAYCSYYSSGETCYCLNEYRTHFYAFHEVKPIAQFPHLKTWQYSSDLCRFMGGHLAAFDTAEKRRWIAEQRSLSVMDGVPTFVGLERVGSEWHWHTSNGTRPAHDIPWSTIQPGDFPYASAVRPYMTFTKTKGAAKDNGLFLCEFEKSSGSEETTTTAPITTTAIDAGLLTCDQIYGKWKDDHHHSSSGYTNPLECGVVDSTCYCRNLVVLKGSYENNWLFARDQCLKFGGRLAKLETEKKVQQVANWLGEYLDFYIGLRKEKGVWTWIDGSVAQDINWHKAAVKSNQIYHAVLSVDFNPPPSAISLTHYDTPYYVCEHTDYRERIMSKDLTCSEMEHLWSQLHKFSYPKCNTFNNKCYCSNSVYPTDFSKTHFEFGNNSCYGMNGLLAKVDNTNMITWLHAWLGELDLFTGLRKEGSLWVWNDEQVAATVPWNDGHPKDLPAYDNAHLVLKQPLERAGFITMSSEGMYYLCEHDEFKNDAWIYTSEEFERSDTKDKSCPEIEEVWKEREEQLSTGAHNRTGDSACSSLGNQCFCINRIRDLDLTSTSDAWEYSDQACKMMGADLAKINSQETIDWFWTWMRLDMHNISVYIGARNENNEWIWNIDDSKVNIETQGLLDENKHAYIHVPSKWEAEAVMELRSNNGHFEDCIDSVYLYCRPGFNDPYYYADNHFWYYMCQYYV